jgi:hypothetical protein
VSAHGKMHLLNKRAALNKNIEIVYKENKIKENE